MTQPISATAAAMQMARRYGVRSPAPTIVVETAERRIQAARMCLDALCEIASPSLRPVFLAIREAEREENRLHHDAVSEGENIAGAWENVADEAGKLAQYWEARAEDAA